MIRAATAIAVADEAMGERVLRRWLEVSLKDILISLSITFLSHQDVMERSQTSRTSMLGSPPDAATSLPPPAANLPENSTQVRRGYAFTSSRTLTIGTW